MASIELTDEELIELAKLAKPVKLNAHFNKVFIGSHYPPLNQFMEKIGLQPGNKKIKVKELYNLFIQIIINSECSQRKFTTELFKIFKRSSVHYLLTNMSLEDLKQHEKRHHEKESDKEETDKTF